MLTQLPEKNGNKVNAWDSKSKMLSKPVRTMFSSDEPVPKMLIFIVFETIWQLTYDLQYIEIFTFDKRCLDLHIKSLLKSVSYEWNAKPAFEGKKYLKAHPRLCKIHDFACFFSKVHDLFLSQLMKCKFGI